MSAEFSPVAELGEALDYVSRTSEHLPASAKGLRLDLLAWDMLYALHRQGVSLSKQDDRRSAILAELAAMGITREGRW